MAQVVWYAKKGSCNIDDTELWTLTKGGTDYQQIAAATNGANGTILAANGQTGILINGPFTAVRISTAVETGSTTGGGFTFAGTTSRAITTNLLAGPTPCLVTTHTAGTLTITGNITGGGSAGANGLTVSGVAGGITVAGTVTGGSNATAYGVHLNANNITYAQTGGDVLGVTAPAIYQLSSATGITGSNTGGNITGGAANSAMGIRLATNTIWTVTGANITAGAGTTSPGVWYGYQTDSAKFCTLVSCNLINSAYEVAVQGNVKYVPGAGNYIRWQYDSNVAHYYYYAKTVIAGNVLVGVNGDGSTLPTAGTLVVPNIADVRKDTQYGPNGTGLTGQLVPSGVIGTGGMSGGLL